MRLICLYTGAQSSCFFGTGLRGKFPPLFRHRAPNSRSTNDAHGMHASHHLSQDGQELKIVQPVMYQLYKEMEHIGHSSHPAILRTYIMLSEEAAHALCPLVIGLANNVQEPKLKVAQAIAAFSKKNSLFQFKSRLKDQVNSIIEQSCPSCAKL